MQVISFKKMVVLSAKFTIVIPWSLICICLIVLSALKKLAGTSEAILYNNMESRHPWRTRTRVNVSDRRSFILILYLTLVYATPIMQLVYAICEWICLHIRTYAKQKR